MNNSKSNFNYSIVFTSLEEYKTNDDYKEIFNVINQTQLIKEQQELIDLFKKDDICVDSIGYTKA